jgi:hypothetical protein
VSEYLLMELSERHLWIQMKPFLKLEVSMSAPSPVDESKAPAVQMGADDKYLVDIFAPPKAIPSPKESLEAIKGAVKGKMLARMKKEAVDCPVKLKKVSFVECFTCPNFNRRVRGKVGCKGLPLPTK